MMDLLVKGQSFLVKYPDTQRYVRHFDTAGKMFYYYFDISLKY
jgi:hypothetical protein|tara:strand:- start:673 stop:801 length:129 start_codon:yes stop_codon:yes gene_type:complete